MQLLPAVDTARKPNWQRSRPRSVSATLLRFEKLVDRLAALSCRW